MSVQNYATDSGSVHIYALLDPESLQVRYVGKSVRPNERLSNHMNEPPSSCHRSHWIQALKRRGLRPVLVILESVCGAWPWQESERYWIKRGRTLGWPLTNNTSGGDGVCDLPPESRARMARTWLGRKHSPETIAKLKRARALRPGHSEETRRKMSVAHSGRTITWGDKLAEKSRKLTPEECADVNARLARGETVKSVAADLGVHRTTLSKIKLGRYFVRGQRSELTPCTRGGGS